MKIQQAKKFLFNWTNWSLKSVKYNYTVAGTNSLIGGCHRGAWLTQQFIVCEIERGGIDNSQEASADCNAVLIVV